MNIKTSGFNKYSHPEFVIEAELALAADVDWFIRTLESEVAAGRKYEHDQLIEFGCGTLRVQKLSDGHLTLLEPDYNCFPIVWNEGVSKTLKLYRLQSDTATGLGGTPRFCSFKNSLIVGADLEQDGEYLLERTESTDDSGWFVGNPESKIGYEAVDNLTRVSVYALLARAPQVAMFLAIPPQVRIEVRRALLRITSKTSNLYLASDFLQDFASRQGVKLVVE